MWLESALEEYASEHAEAQPVYLKVKDQAHVGEMMDRAEFASLVKETMGPALGQDTAIEEEGVVAEAKRCFDELDLDHDGFVSKEEFIACHGGADEGVFQLLDKDKDGRVTQKEWDRFCDKLG